MCVWVGACVCACLDATCAHESWWVGVCWICAECVVLAMWLGVVTSRVCAGCCPMVALLLDLGWGCDVTDMFCDVTDLQG
jgi:hypothetical protein